MSTAPASLLLTCHLASLRRHSTDQLDPPTEEQKWDLLRLANTKGKLMKALGVITRAPKMLE